MFARELAHVHPDKVRAVVTLCSPFSGDFKTNTNVREFYERIAGHDVNAPPFPRANGKPPVPTLGLLVARGMASSRRAPRAGKTMRSIRRSRSTPIMWAPFYGGRR